MAMDGGGATNPGICTGASRIPRSRKLERLVLLPARATFNGEVICGRVLIRQSCLRLLSTTFAEQWDGTKSLDMLRLSLKASVPFIGHCFKRLLLPFCR
jgi:hypothetical protein